ncbi:MAG: NnrS family protein, partial [Hyphomicrobium sp.]
LTASLAALACGLNVLRMARWCGWQTASEPLVLILHVGFAFVPLGFLLVCLASLRPDMVLPTGALHAWTTGAIGVMTLAVMTRASLGHTGRKLVATPAITAIYVLAVAAALARIVAAFGISRELTLALSASAWVLAFAIFAVVYAPMLAGRRI